MPYRMHPEMKLGTVKLKVSNLKRSLEFYQDVVGFRILRQTESSAELTADGVNVLLDLREIPDAVITPRRSVSGLYHFAILLPGRKDLGIALRRLIEKGIRVGHSDHLVSEALYITDPDQNGIEIYRDRPRAEWQYDADNRIVMGGEPIDIDGLLKEAEETDWNGLPPGTTIGHVHFHVGDLQKAKSFYCDILGFDVMAHPVEFRAMFISAGGYHHHIGLNLWAGEDAPPAPANGTGIEYFTIVLPDDEEIGKVSKRLRDSGIAVEERDGALFAADPFGIGMRFIVSQPQ